MEDIKTIELQTEFEYAYKGETEKAKTVELVAPRASWASEISVIKSQINRAAQEHLKNNPIDPTKKEKEEELAPEELGKAMLTLVGMFADLSEMTEAFKRLMCKGAVKIQPTGLVFTSAFFDKLSYKDLEVIMGSYIGNFIQS